MSDVIENDMRFYARLYLVPDSLRLLPPKTSPVLQKTSLRAEEFALPFSCYITHNSARLNYRSRSISHADNSDCVSSNSPARRIFPLHLKRIPLAPYRRRLAALASRARLIVTPRVALIGALPSRLEPTAQLGAPNLARVASISELSLAAPQCIK